MVPNSVSVSFLIWLILCCRVLGVVGLLIFVVVSSAPDFLDIYIYYLLVLRLLVDAQAWSHGPMPYHTNTMPHDPITLSTYHRHDAAEHAGPEHADLRAWQRHHPRVPERTFFSMASLFFRTLPRKAIFTLQKNGAKSGFGMCFAPSTLGAGVPTAPTKTRLESSIKPRFFVCRYPDPACMVSQPSMNGMQVNHTTMNTQVQSRETQASNRETCYLL